MLNQFQNNSQQSLHDKKNYNVFKSNIALTVTGFFIYIFMNCRLAPSELGSNSYYQQSTARHV